MSALNTHVSADAPAPSTPDYGALWQLPSDHLPIGARVNGINLASWNVLNSEYIDYIKRNEQGLADSILVRDNRVIEQSGSGLTVRERATLDIIQQSLPSLQAFFLQECGARFLNSLVQELPENWRLVTGSSVQGTNDIAALLDFNAVRVDRERSETIEAAYPRCRIEAPKTHRPIMNLLLRTPSGDALRVIHSHVPGNPQHPGLLEFAEYVARVRQSTTQPLLALGDLNFPEASVQAEFAAQGIGSFHNAQPLNTIVGNDRMPKRIDHLIYFGDPSHCAPLSSNLFGPEAAATARLLNPPDVNAQA